MYIYTTHSTMCSNEIGRKWKKEREKEKDTHEKLNDEREVRKCKNCMECSLMQIEHTNKKKKRIFFFLCKCEWLFSLETIYLAVVVVVAFWLEYLLLSPELFKCTWIWTRKSIYVLYSFGMFACVSRNFFLFTSFAIYSFK